MQLLQPLRNKEAAVLLHNIAYRVRGNSGYLAVPTIGWERSSSEWPGPLRSLGTRPYPINDTACKNSDYIGNFVYKNDTLQYILNSEGRARPVLNTANETRFVYDYFVKDHLGNVRSTVTAEPINFDYIASHEIAMAGVEQLVFDNIPNVRDNKPGGGGGDVMAVRLNGGESDKRIGTAIMLHAMPGDRFTVSADAFYEGSYQQSTEEVGSDAIVQSLAAALMGGTTYEGVPVSELPDNAKLAGSILGNPSLPTTLSTLVDQTNNPGAPKAHLNILFFDENMRLIPQASSITQVTQNNLNNANGWTVLTPTGTGGGPHPGAPGPGYVVIFVDNQSIGKDVWFDNIMVGHYTGTVQEESHYYPFGLTLQTDVQTPEVTKQVYKYNGKELEKSFGLEMYDYGARMFDPQIGRMPNPDPMAGKFNSFSPYNYALNNPVNIIDPDGRSATYTYDKGSNTLTISAKVYYQGKDLPKGAEERKALIDKINEDLKSTYKDGTGKSGDQEWTVKFDITAEINENVKEGDLKDGENIMTVNTDAPQLLQLDGTKRQNVKGDKANMGYLAYKAGTNVDVHEIGHMLGFSDRYTDYKRTDGSKESRSISHDGYRGDLFGAFSILSLNQSHYDDAVQYTNYKLTTGQSHLLPQYRSNSFNVNDNFDNFHQSATAPGDIPSGWVEK